jgi:hypothetical protein
VTARRQPTWRLVLAYTPPLIVWCVVGVAVLMFIVIQGSRNYLNSQRSGGDSTQLANEMAIILDDRVRAGAGPGVFTVTDKRPYLSIDGVSLSLPHGATVTIVAGPPGLCATASMGGRVYWQDPNTGSLSTTRPVAGPCTQQPADFLLQGPP